MEKHLKFLKSYDMFGYPISLSFKKKSTYTTIWGGFFSIIVICLLTSLFTYSFYKLFNREYLETSKYIMNLGNEYGSLELNTENFMIAIKFDSELINNWTQPFINITLLQVTQYRNITNTWKIKKKINLIPCTSEHFLGLESDFNILQLKSALCPGLGSNLTIQGNFQEAVFSYLSISLTSCLDNKTCQNNITVYNTIKKLEKIRFQMFIINNNIDELNIDNPLKRTVISDIHFLVDPIKDVYRTADIYLTETEITTDYGYTPTMLNKLETIKNFTYLQEFREQTVFTSTQVNIAEFYLRKSQNKVIYDRQLGNILTVLSYLGGIWSSLYFAIFIFIQKYTENSFITKLSNKIYTYPSQKKNKRKNKKTRYSTLNQSKEMTPHSETKKSIYITVITKIKDYLNYDRKLVINFLEMTKIIIKNILRCKQSDEKSILFEKSENNLMKDLDIFNILRRLHELEKIKNLLFTEDQQLVLDFFPKPAILLEKDDRKKSSILRVSNLKTLKRLANTSKKTFLFEQTNNYDDIANFKELIFAWKKLKSEENNSEINKKLIETLGNEFFGMIDIQEEDLNRFLEISKNSEDENQINKSFKPSKSFFFQKQSKKLGNFIKIDARENSSLINLPVIPFKKSTEKEIKQLKKRKSSDRNELDSLNNSKISIKNSSLSLFNDSK